MYEIMNKKEEAIKTLEYQFEKNLKKLNDLSDEEVKNLSQIMNMIENNIIQWKNEMDSTDKKSKKFLITKSKKLY